MNKLIKPILAICIAATLLLSTFIVTFAGDSSDPGVGKCIFVPKLEAIQ